MLLLGLVSSQAAPAAAAKECSFEFRNGLIWLNVTSTESAHSLHFLLDTGAGVSVLNTTTLETLNLRRGRPVKVKGVETSATGYWPQRLVAKIGEIALPEQFLGVDLSELSRACTCSVDGLLGVDFFRGRTVQIDFSAHKIRLLERVEVSPGSQVLPLQVAKSALRTSVQINGEKPVQVRLDTGCASALEWVTANAPVETAAKAACIGLSKNSISQASTTLRLATLTMADVPTGLHAQRIFPEEDGLLGNGILSRFTRITIDAKHRRLILDR